MNIINSNKSSISTKIEEENNSKSTIPEKTQRKLKREIVRIKYFTNDSWEFNLETNLLKFQQESYERLLSKDSDCQYSLHNIFKNNFPLTDSSQKVIVEYLDYSLEKPSFSSEECKNRGTTYGMKVNIHLRTRYKLNVTDKTESKENNIKDHKEHKEKDKSEKNSNSNEEIVKEEWFTIGQLPIQTEKCSFIINGNERYVISQIKRCPGLLLSKETDLINRLSPAGMYVVKMVPSRGSWLEFCVDSKDVIFIRIDRKKKIEFTKFLMCFPDPTDENKTFFTREKILSYFYPKYTIEYLASEQKIKVPVEKLLLQDRLFSVGIYDKDGNELSTPKTKLNIKNLQNYSYIYMELKGFLDFVSLYDVFNNKTGEIYIEAGDNFTESFLNYIKKEKTSIKYDVIAVGNSREDNLVLNTVRKEKINTRHEALTVWARLMKHSEYAGFSGLHTYFVNSYLSKKLYDMSTIGRRRCLQKIPSNILLSPQELEEYKNTKVTFLTHFDIISMVQNLIGLYKNEITEDDPDSYINRRIRAVGELISIQVTIGLEKLIKKFITKSISVESITNYSQDILNVKRMFTYLYEFFNTSQLSQFASQENALSQVAHSKKVSVFGMGGISGGTTTNTAFDLRDIQPSQNCLMCVAETPEGNQIGLVTNLTIGAELDSEGFIVTPFYIVKNGVITDEIVKLGAFEISKKVFAPKDSFVLNKETQKRELKEEYLMCSINSRMELVHKDKVEITQVTPIQMFSAPTSLIPNSNHNDGYRTAMSAAMLKQAIAPFKCEPPLVGTGIEKYVARYSGEVIIAKNPGIVRMVDSQSIVIETNHELVPTIDLYQLRKFERSNQDTCVNQTPLVKIGDMVEKGDIIADGYSIYKGELALGKNFLTLYLTNAFCFEDSIVVNKDVVESEAGSSVHVYSYEIEAQDTRYGMEEITRDLPDVRCDEVAHLDECGIICVGEEIYPGKILVGKVTPQGSDNSKDPQKKLLQAMFYNRTENYKKTPLIVPPSIYGRVTRVKIFTKSGVELNDSALMNYKIQLEKVNGNFLKSKNILLDFFLKEQIYKIILGESITNNVGKLKKQTIIDESQYPFIKELSLNQLKLVSTTNNDINKKIKTLIQQIEKQINNLEKKLEDNINELSAEYKFPNDTTIQKVVIEITKSHRMNVGDKLASRYGNKGVISATPNRVDMPYLEDGRIVDLIFNPLGILARMNLGQLYEMLINICTEKMRTCISNFLKQYLKFNNKETMEQLKKAIIDGVGSENVGDFFINEPLSLSIWDLSDYEVVQLAHKLSEGIYSLVPPFESVNLERIQELLKKHELSTNGKVKVYDGKTSQLLEGLVLVGYQFILKLSHMVVNKIHYRNTGPYLSHTAQPTHGRQREGGQKIGEMENWAIAANGGAFTSLETTVKSDNEKARKECYKSHSTNGFYTLSMDYLKKQLNNFLNKKDYDKNNNKDDDNVEPSFALVREELFACCFKIKKQKITYTEHVNKKKDELLEELSEDELINLDTDIELLEERNIKEKIAMYKDDSLPRYREIISFSLASPEDIIRTSHGMVTNTETLNYRTRNGEKNGLFCEVIFGPLNNYECACKKYTQKKYYRVKCDKCGVTVLPASARRYRRGYIKLAYEMVHPFYLKPNNNKICILLNLTSQEMLSIVALDAWIVISPNHSQLKHRQVLNKEEYEKFQEKFPMDATEDMIGTGAHALRILLEQIDFEKEKINIKEEIKKCKSSVAKKTLLHRLVVLQRMEDNQIRPEWMILTHIPILPANLRQIVEIAPHEYASSDLNSLYREVISRNIRLKELINLNINTMIYNEIRMTQASVNALFGGTIIPKKISSLHKYKSLAEFLQGKTGRFRQNLLGKRVDYSGRSVIVVAPNLKLNECYLPRKMMAKLLSSHLIYELKKLGIANTFQDAQKIIDEADKHIKIWDLLQEITPKLGHVLLNRAPSLHRLSMLSFKYKLWNKDAIGLHPLVCKAFNADFDGDQMAVHLPISIEGQLESEILMLSSNNIASPTDGKIVIGPRQDITIGIYTLTIPKNKDSNINKKKPKFINFYELNSALTLNKINARDEILFYVNNKWEDTTVGRVLLWQLMPVHENIKFSIVNMPITEKECNQLLQLVRDNCGDKETVKLADNIKSLGFEYAEKFGISISLDEFPKIQKIKELKNNAFNKQKEYEMQYGEGLISFQDKENKIHQIWTEIIHIIQTELEKLINTNNENPVFLSIASKARGSVLQLLQIIGLKGFVAKVDGSTSNMVIDENYIDGLNSFKLFAAQSGARNSGTNSSLKTSQSGYLTRKLVDCAHAVICTIFNCTPSSSNDNVDDSIDGITVQHTIRSSNLQFTLGEQILGRILSAPIINPLNGEIVFYKNHLITKNDIKLLDSIGIVKCKIRSPITCKAKNGVCVLCYGVDLSTGDLVTEGEAVGIIAAQSIGEPGSQLTLKSKSFGGVAQQDTASTTVKSAFKGKVRYSKIKVVNINGKNIVFSRGSKIIIMNEKGNVELIEYILPYGAELIKENDSFVEIGDLLAQWGLYQPIFSETKGICKYENIIDNITCDVFFDDIVGRSYKIIKSEYNTKNNLIPTLIVYSEDNTNEELARYILEENTIIAVEDGEKVELGTILGKIQQHVFEKLDIVGGLPLVSSFLENRQPKVPSILAPFSGYVEIIKDGKGKVKIQLTNEKNPDEIIEYILNKNNRAIVHSGEYVEQGDELTFGTPILNDILNIKGIDSFINYAINGIQEIYAMQGIKINNKHFEIILSKLLSKVIVKNSGDSLKYVEDEIMEYIDVLAINEELARENKKPIIFQRIVMGLTAISLKTRSLLSAMSFQETTKVLADSIHGDDVETGKNGISPLGMKVTNKVFPLGLKESLISGDLVRLGSGFVLSKIIDTILYNIEKSMIESANHNKNKDHEYYDNINDNRNKNQDEEEIMDKEEETMKHEYAN